MTAHPPDPFLSVSDLARSRVRQVFEFLKAFDQLRNPPILRREQLDWQFNLIGLPSHPGVWCPYPVEDNAAGLPGAEFRLPERLRGRGIILAAKRPKTSDPKAPPKKHEDWVRGSWRDPFAEVSLVESREESGQDGTKQTIRLEANAERSVALRTWFDSWQTWAAAERPARQAMTVFSDLYALQGRLEREGDRQELVVGDGVLNWSIAPAQGASILLDHPLLLQPAELFLDTDTFTFFVIETDAPVELYTSLLRQAPLLAGESLATLRRELEELDISPVGGTAVDAFLRRVGARLDPRFEFLRQSPQVSFASRPVIWRSPMLFLRSRSRGFAKAIDEVLEGMSQGREIPGSLIRIVGLEPDSHSADASPIPQEPRPSGGIEQPDPDLLFSKPWNKEQERILARLERSDSVVVQGPPGTGKTHTIANLIGHLLATGRSVLVTSHTEKALKVVRDFVVPPLQPLCLPVLGSDIDSRKELERSVETILEHISFDDADRLESQIRTLRARRQHLLEQKAKLSEELRETRLAEYRDIVFGGEAIPPSTAARQVKESVGLYEWIPGPIILGAALPLSDSDLGDLYSSNVELTTEDEGRLRAGLPPVEQLPAPEQLAAIKHDLENLAPQSVPSWDACWKEDPPARDADALEQLLSNARTVLDGLEAMEPWQSTLADLALQGSAAVSGWRDFLKYLDTELPGALRIRDDINRLGPTLPVEIEPSEVQNLAETIEKHLHGGRKLSRWALVRHPDWRRLADAATVANRRPKKASDFSALRQAADLEVRRAELLTWWHQLAREVGYGRNEHMESEPELVFAQLRDAIAGSLDFEPKVWEPFLQRLSEVGFQKRSTLNGPIAESRLSLIRALVPLLINHLAERRRRSLRAGVAAAHRAFVETSEQLCSGLDPGLSSQLIASCQALDVDGHRGVLREVERIRTLAPVFEKRKRLLSALAAAAPRWAKAISQREGPHGTGQVPGDPVRAWRLCQLLEELDRRAGGSADAKALKLEECERELRHATAELIEVQSWASQKRRTKGPARQALVGWKDIQRAMPRTSTVPGKLERLRRSAREAMLKCQGAVPVWIMPMHRVVENFDFRTPCFDVVIVDEASQNDILGLLLFALGRKIVVVGDHEQVSPSDVGQAEAQVGRLIDEHLTGVPNSALYTGKTSIYHLARQSAGETIMLLEHFRCLPDIIEFSNQLCYEGRIRPLREPATARVAPTFAPYRVNGHVRGSTNEAEAQVVASLLAACTENQAYRNLTLGVISLVGDEQALRIETLLRHYVDLGVLQRHRVVCGNAAQFQGDERDVMFLSMVDAPADGPLRLRNEDMFRQRFNVAVSRAKDQVWVVHSVSSDTDLKPNDLRRRLLVHAANPKATEQLISAIQARTESPFEKAVAAALIRRGYQVIPQYRVGYYRIDLVVRGGGHQLAVECDGDRFHPEEKIDEDLARQAVLERLGWRFARIRGSVFFRDPDSAMAPVFKALDRLGIVPEAGVEPGAEEQRHDLRDEVIRRAEALREDWQTKIYAHDTKDQPRRGFGAVRRSGQEPPERPTSQPSPETPEGGATAAGLETPQSPAAPTSLGTGTAHISGTGATLSSVPATAQAGTAPLVRPAAASPSNEIRGAVANQGQDAKSEPSRASKTSPAPDQPIELSDKRSAVWLALSKWAKEKDYFEPWERGLLYTIGDHLRRGWTLTYKQVWHANRLFAAALASGFKLEASATQGRLFEDH